jgi:ornithine cyclodeaminase/alanine dehydrogenase-like protein (mu-crystallin family)
MPTTNIRAHEQPRDGFPSEDTGGHDAVLASPVRLLSDADVRLLLKPAPLVDLMEQGLAAFSAGHVVNPLRTVLYAGNPCAYVGIMPAFLPSEGALGAKLVTAFASNKDRGLPSHFATIVLLDAVTGRLQAIVDGRYITEMRTAAVSAVALRHLGRPPVKVLAVLGAGVQARGHLETLDALHAVEEFRVWSPVSARERFTAESWHFRAPLTVVLNAEAAVRGADAVLLVTDSPEPVVRSSWVAPGTLIISVGACRPDHREIDPDLLQRSWLIVDSRASALSESGDVVSGLAEQLFDAGHIRGELGDVILGRVPARTSPADVVVFKSLGLGMEDVAAAALVCRLAAEQGIGQRVVL